VVSRVRVKREPGPNICLKNIPKLKELGLQANEITLESTHSKRVIRGRNCDDPGAPGGCAVRLAIGREDVNGDDELECVGYSDPRRARNAIL
jgi:hypothetical protein